MGLVFVPMSTLAFDQIDSARQDEASGLYGVTRQLGSSIGIAIVGAMIVRGLAMDTALLTQHVTPYSAAAQAYLAPLGLSPPPRPVTVRASRRFLDKRFAVTRQRASRNGARRALQ